MLHYEIAWTGTDVDLTLPLIDGTQARFEGMEGCTFDSGFHSKANQIGADERLVYNGIKPKGEWSQAIIERERQPVNRKARSDRIMPEKPGVLWA